MPRQVWSESMMQFIIDNANRLTDEEMAKRLTVLLGREVTVMSVRKARHRCGIKKAAGRGYTKVVARLCPTKDKRERPDGKTGVPMFIAGSS